MNDIGTSKHLKKKAIPHFNGKKKYIYFLFGRTLISVLLLLLALILCKSNASYKEEIYKNIYNTNLSFTTFHNFYDKYLGGIIPLENILGNIEPVFSETLKYKDESKYLDGVRLSVDRDYLVPVIEAGIIVYIGEKDGYGTTIIIQGMDGVDIWYGNMNNTAVKLYDYVLKGSPLGEIKGEELYLAYSKNSEFLNYEEYLK